MSRFAKGNGANKNNKRTSWYSALTDEDDIGSRSGSPSLRAMLEPDSKKQRQHLSPPSPDDRAPRGRLAAPVAKGTPKTMTSPSSSSPMSFSDALNKAKVAAEAEKVREGDAPRAQTTTAYQPRKIEKDEEAKEDDEVELHILGSFDFGDHGGGAAHEIWVWVLPVLNRSMLLVYSRTCGGGYSRDECGQGHPLLRLSPSFRPPILSTLTVTVITCHTFGLLQQSWSVIIDSHAVNCFLKSRQSPN